MGKRTNYNAKVVETLRQIPGRTFTSSDKSDENVYLVSGNWSSDVRGLIRKLLCSTSVIDQPVGTGFRDLPRHTQDDMVRFCKRRGITHPRSRTLYTFNRDRRDQVNRDLLMQRTPIVIVKGIKRCDDILTYNKHQTLDFYPFPADPT